MLIVKANVERMLENEEMNDEKDKEEQAVYV